MKNQNIFDKNFDPKNFDRMKFEKVEDDNTVMMAFPIPEGMPHDFFSEIMKSLIKCAQYTCIERLPESKTPDDTEYFENMILLADFVLKGYVVEMCTKYRVSDL